jgi:hypothetical protein
VLQGSGECRFTVFSGSPISSITMDGAELGFTVLENGAYSVSALLGGKHTVTVA